MENFYWSTNFTTNLQSIAHPEVKVSLLKKLKVASLVLGTGCGIAAEHTHRN